MALKSTEQRLDKMVKVRDSAPGIEVEYMAPDVPVKTPVPPIETGEITAQPDPAMLESPIEEPLEDDITKPVFVAGTGSALRGIVREAEKAAREAAEGIPGGAARVPGERVEPTMQPEPVKQGDELLIPEATEETVEAVGAAVGARREAREAGALPAKPPEEAFNTTRMEGNVADIVRGTADALGIKTERVTFDEIKSKADELGIDARFVNQLITEGGEMVGNATNVYRAMSVLEESSKVLDDMFTKVNSGQATEADYLKLRQQITFHGLIQKSVKGIQSETARALAIMRVPRNSNGAVIRQILDEGGGVNSLQTLARAYMRSGLTTAAKNRMLEKTMTSAVTDLWFATWINGLLSSPVTHAKNIIGNAAFGMYRVPETMIASMFSRMPEALRVGRESINPFSPRFYKTIPYSAEEMIAFGDVISSIESTSYTFKNAFKRASKAFKENAPQDGLTKVELEGRYERDITADLFGMNPDTHVAKAVNLYGKVITAPGRMLMTEDEWFKSVFFDNSFRMQVNARVRNVYRQSMEMGDTEASALAKAEMEARDLYTSPPDDMVQTALDAGRRGTFTMDLPPSWKRLEHTIQTPALKMFIPFFRTPTNIMFEVIERTPFAPLSSRFRQDMAQGGPARDLALAKVTMGSMFLYGTTELAANGYIIGSGPGRRADKEAFRRAGGQPYSIVLPRERFNDDQIQRLSSVGKLSLSDDKIYMSFNGLEPVGALLAIGADYASFAAYSQNAEDTSAVFGGAVYGMYNYMRDQPFLQGASEILALLGGVWDNEVNPEDFTNGITKQIGSFAIGGSPAGAYSSFVASLERYLDPEMTDTSIKGLGMDAGIAGFYESFLRYRSRIPEFNDDLPPRLNLWGDVDISGRGSPDELILPTRVSPGQFSEIDNELFQLGSPISMPSRAVDGVEITGVQYNQLLTIYSKELNAKEELTNLIYTPGYALLRDGIKQAQLRKVHDRVMGIARDILVSRDPELQLKIQELKQLKLDNLFAK